MKTRTWFLWVLLACMVWSLWGGEVKPAGSKSPGTPAFTDRAVIIVNTLQDEKDNSCQDGDCSLRDAIGTASADDTIQFSVTGVISLTLGQQLVLDKNLTILGPGLEDLAVSGNYATRVFWVNSGVLATISGLSVTNSKILSGNLEGGGLFNFQGAVTLSDCAFTNHLGFSRGAAIDNAGVMMIHDCIFSKNQATKGGAIYTSGTLIATGSTFNDNTGTDGAAIYNYSGEAIFSDSVFLDNYSFGDGGGIYNVNRGELSVTNCVFTNNESFSDGGGIANMDYMSAKVTADILNSEFYTNTSGKGGAIYNGFAMTVTHSIFSGNSSPDFRGGALYNNNTLVVAGSAISHSLAIDGGGIFNLKNLVVNDTSFYNNTATNAGSGIFNFANAEVNQSTFIENFAEDRGTINNTGNLECVGCAFLNNWALHGGVHNDGWALMDDCAFTGNMGGTGSGVYNDVGEMEVWNSVFTANRATWGSAIFNNDNGELYVYQTTFTGNEGFIPNRQLSPALREQANGDTFGAGIDNEGYAQVASCIFYDNRATEGAGVSNHGVMHLEKSSLYNNTGEMGGGIFNTDVLTVSNTTIYSNTAIQGGGVMNEEVLWLINSTLYSNTAIEGGGIHNAFTALLTNTIVTSLAGGDCFLVLPGGAFQAGSTHNLASDSTCAPGFTQVTEAELRLGLPAGSLLYLPLEEGSAAIDAGTNTNCPGADQIGTTRPQDGDDDSLAVCDVGAIEFTPAWINIYLPLVVR